MPYDVSSFTVRPEHQTTLTDMYAERGTRVPMFVIRPDQKLETVYTEATPYTGEPYGANAIIDSYMYHMNVVAGMYLTVKLKGECS